MARQMRTLSCSSMRSSAKYAPILPAMSPIPYPVNFA